MPDIVVRRFCIGGDFYQPNDEVCFPELIARDLRKRGLIRTIHEDVPNFPTVRRLEGVTVISPPPETPLPPIMRSQLKPPEMTPDQIFQLLMTDVETLDQEMLSENSAEQSSVDLSALPFPGKFELFKEEHNRPNSLEISTLKPKRAGRPRKK